MCMIAIGPFLLIESCWLWAVILTYSPGQNNCKFGDKRTKFMFFKNKCYAVLLKFHQSLFLKSPINNQSALSHRADSRLVPSQWEMSLQANAVSHWLGANIESALFQVMTETMLVYCQLIHWEQISVKFLSKFKRFHSRTCAWKSSLQNGGHFVLASKL